MRDVNRNVWKIALAVVFLLPNLGSAEGYRYNPNSYKKSSKALNNYAGALSGRKDRKGSESDDPRERLEQLQEQLALVKGQTEEETRLRKEVNDLKNQMRNLGKLSKVPGQVVQNRLDQIEKDADAELKNIQSAQAPVSAPFNLNRNVSKRCNINGVLNSFDEAGKVADLLQSQPLEFVRQTSVEKLRSTKEDAREKTLAKLQDFLDAQVKAAKWDRKNKNIGPQLRNVSLEARLGYLEKYKKKYRKGVEDRTIQVAGALMKMTKDLFGIQDEEQDAHDTGAKVGASMQQFFAAIETHVQKGFDQLALNCEALEKQLGLRGHSSPNNVFSGNSAIDKVGKATAKKLARAHGVSRNEEYVKDYARDKMRRLLGEVGGLSCPDASQGRAQALSILAQAKADAARFGSIGRHQELMEAVLASTANVAQLKNQLAESANPILQQCKLIEDKVEEFENFAKSSGGSGGSNISEQVTARRNGANRRRGGSSRRRGGSTHRGR